MMEECFPSKIGKRQACIFLPFLVNTEQKVLAPQKAWAKKKKKIKDLGLGKKKKKKNYTQAAWTSESELTRI